mmetsp:Transcript_12586/g.41247  ORF Transcript_12586/g.41247 Transcript_12586/m.41247 type:complete len:289 (+) Transcript_12586:2989-3855(+)
MMLLERRRLVMDHFISPPAALRAALVVDFGEELAGGAGSAAEGLEDVVGEGFVDVVALDDAAAGVFEAAGAAEAVDAGVLAELVVEVAQGDAGAEADTGGEARGVAAAEEGLLPVALALVAVGGLGLGLEAEDLAVVAAEPLAAVVVVDVFVDVLGGGHLSDGVGRVAVAAAEVADIIRTPELLEERGARHCHEARPDEQAHRQRVAEGVPLVALAEAVLPLRLTLAKQLLIARPRQRTTGLALQPRRRLRRRQTRSHPQLKAVPCSSFLWLAARLALLDRDKRQRRS